MYFFKAYLFCLENPTKSADTLKIHRHTHKHIHRYGYTRALKSVCVCLCVWGWGEGGHTNILSWGSNPLCCSCVCNSLVCGLCIWSLSWFFHCIYIFIYTDVKIIWYEKIGNNACYSPRFEKQSRPTVLMACTQKEYL